MIAWLFAGFGFFMAVRWEWSFEDGYRAGHSGPALMDVSISIQGGRFFHSVLFPAFDGIAFQPPHELSVLLLVPDSPKGTPYSVFNLQFKEDRGQARPLKIEGEKGPMEEFRGTIGQESLPADINFDPNIFFRSKIDSRASSFLYEFDVALDLPGGAKTRHVEIRAFRQTKTTLTWEPFDL